VLGIGAERQLGAHPQRWPERRSEFSDLAQQMILDELSGRAGHLADQNPLHCCAVLTPTLSVGQNEARRSLRMADIRGFQWSNTPLREGSY